jgi:hypothetical protein
MDAADKAAKAVFDAGTAPNPLLALGELPPLRSECARDTALDESGLTDNRKASVASL